MGKWIGQAKKRKTPKSDKRGRYEVLSKIGGLGGMLPQEIVRNLNFEGYLDGRSSTRREYCLPKSYKIHSKVQV